MSSSSATSVFSVLSPLAVPKIVNFRPVSPRITMNNTSSVWAKGLESKLETLVQLPHGWDGYCARPVSFTNAFFALNMLERLYSAAIPPPDLVPGQAGDLQAEWHIGDVDLELHVLGPNQVRAWRATPETGEDGEEFDLTNDFTMVGEWIKQLADSGNAIAAAAA